MIKAVFYRNANQSIIGFRVSGHAGFAKAGKDIVCSAVSMLTINTINSIEVHSNSDFRMEQGDDGLIQFKFLEGPDEIGQVLLNTLEMGLVGVQESYGSKYLEVHYKEV